jgi:hydroxycarboxylate dehydrogenase B
MMHTLLPNQLQNDITQLFEHAGVSKQEAHLVADNLVLSNLSGHDSHGVGMAPRYIDAIFEKRLIPGAKVTSHIDHACLLGLNGHGGFGQSVGVEAMNLAFEKVKSEGACIMSLSNSHHLGRIGHFAEMAVSNGWISIHFVNVLSRPVVAAFQAGDGRFGTNPCCIGIPIGIENNPLNNAFILDFATSAVAQGKMRVAHNLGKSAKPGLLIDENGHPTTNPSVVVKAQSNGKYGALLTFGEHKGSGLAIACELLGGALSGGGTWRKEANNARAVMNGMLSIVIDPKAMGQESFFYPETQAFVDWLKQSPPEPGTPGMILAGEPERQARLARETAIEIDEATLKELQASAQKVSASGLFQV